MRDLKLVYRATGKDLAEKRLADLEAKWGSKYPIVLRSWQANWDELSAYFKYPQRNQKDHLHYKYYLRDFIGR